MSSLIPIDGTLERVLLDALKNHPEGITFIDLAGTGITEQNIDQVADNLRYGMFIAENDCSLRPDA